MGELGRLIRAHQVGHGYNGTPVSNTAFAKRVGVTKGAVGNWIAGTGLPTADNIRKLATVLGVPHTRVLDAALADAGYQPRRTWDDEPATTTEAPGGLIIDDEDSALGSSPQRESKRPTPGDETG